MKKKILVLAGGKSSEHDISLISKSYILSTLKTIPNLDVTEIIFPKDGSIPKSFLPNQYDYIIPCFHGYPGETGDIQSLLDFYGCKYLGSKSSAHSICFNKISTKLYLDSLGIPNTLFMYGQKNDVTFHERVLDFFDENPEGIFIKAARQGSSVGCAPVYTEANLIPTIEDCFKYDSYLLVEKALKARELEVSVFEYKGEIHLSAPGEVIIPKDSFYSYDEKYSKTSKSETLVVAKITDEQKEEILTYARDAFENLEIKDLARIDFFLTEDEEIFLNEINTFPGLTPISMFPKMMTSYGVSFKDYLTDRIFNS